MHWISLERYSQACLGESGTMMGELLGSLRVAPLFRCFFFLTSPIFLVSFMVDVA